MSRKHNGSISAGLNGPPTREAPRHAHPSREGPKPACPSQRLGPRDSLARDHDKPDSTFVLRTPSICPSLWCARVFWPATSEVFLRRASHVEVRDPERHPARWSQNAPWRDRQNDKENIGTKTPTRTLHGVSNGLPHTTYIGFHWAPLGGSWYRYRDPVVPNLRRYDWTFQTPAYVTVSPITVPEKIGANTMGGHIQRGV